MKKEKKNLLKVKRDAKNRLPWIALEVLAVKKIVDSGPLRADLAHFAFNHTLILERLARQTSDPLLHHGWRLGLLDPRHL